MNVVTTFPPANKNKKEKRQQYMQFRIESRFLQRSKIEALIAKVSV